MFLLQDSGFADKGTQAWKLEQTFHYFDTDKSGFVSFDEFVAGNAKQKRMHSHQFQTAKTVSRPRPPLPFIQPWSA